MKTYHFYKDTDGTMHREGEQLKFPPQEIGSVDKIDVFTERTEINQFLRDGAVINALYDLTLQHLFENRTRNVESKILEVFNKAYKMCWMITSQGSNYSDILKEVFGNRYNFVIRDLSQFVAWSILKVYDQFYDFNKSILNTLRSRTQDKGMLSSYRELVRMQDDPFCPICFDTPGIRHSKNESYFDGLNSDIDEARDVLEFFSNIGHNHQDIEDDEDEDDDFEVKSVDDALCDSLEFIRTVYKAIKTENERLAIAMTDMENNQSKTIEGMETTISRLRIQIAHLNRQLEEKKNTEVVKKNAKEGPLHKILNWDTITDYALGLGDSKDVQVIMNMLNRMSTRNHYFDENLDKNIVKLENYVRELQKPVYNQTNHIGGDYVETQNNHHHKSETHE